MVIIIWPPCVSQANFFIPKELKMEMSEDGTKRQDLKGRLRSKRLLMDTTCWVLNNGQMTLFSCKTTKRVMSELGMDFQVLKENSKLQKFHTLRVTTTISLQRNGQNGWCSCNMAMLEMYEAGVAMKTIKCTGNLHHLILKVNDWFLVKARNL